MALTNPLLIQRRQYRIKMLFVGAICSVVCFSYGIDEGFNTGYKYAYLECNKLLKEGCKGEFNFFIPGIKQKFFPRKDKSGVNMKETIK